MLVLLCYPVELDKVAYGSNDHSLDYFHPTGESRSIPFVGLSAGVIPNLTVCTLAVPTKITIGNCIEREKLETAKQPIFLGNTHLLAEHFNADKFLVRVEQIVVDCWRLQRLASLLTHS